MYSGADSVMASAAETAKLGIVSQTSGVSGDWKKTKPGKTDFGGFSDQNAKIWCDQQKQHLRSLIHQLPFYARALGNVMYTPTGDISGPDLMQIHNHLYRVCMPVIEEQYPSTPPERLAKVRELIYCAICHYWESISPCIDGGVPRGMDAKPAEVRSLMVNRGNDIDTRRWAREYKGIWAVIIGEISKIDSVALDPLERWRDSYLSRLEVMA